VNFAKYQASGNDFIILDNRQGEYQWIKTDHVKQLCDRHFGIGADGLLTINPHDQYEVNIDYRNADGSRSLCGNGSLCAINYLWRQLQHPIASFMAFDGVHFVEIGTNGLSISMSDVESLKRIDDDYEMNTGSPHYIHFTHPVNEFDIVKYGKELRYSDTYKEHGTNVNAVEELRFGHIFIRTYERGVEDETLSCGTGATACALAYAHQQNKLGRNKIRVHTIGHQTPQQHIEITFNYTNNRFSDIQFYNHAEFVFQGIMQLPTTNDTAQDLTR